jgi:hypothetical protein
LVAKVRDDLDKTGIVPEWIAPLLFDVRVFLEAHGWEYKAGKWVEV